MRYVIGDRLPQLAEREVTLLRECRRWTLDNACERYSEQLQYVIVLTTMAGGEVPLALGILLSATR